MNCIKLYVSFAFIIIFAIGGTLIEIYTLFYQYDNISIRNDVPVVLWWTPFGSKNDYKTCGNITCLFTENRSYLNNDNTKVILFYGSNVEVEDLPIPRSGNLRWGLIHEESPKNNLMFVHDNALKLFNYSATFSRYSNVPLTIIDLPGLKELSGTEFFISTMVKNRLIREKKFASILYIQSNCDTMNGRDLYIAELMKYIAVDSYGNCINNRRLPNNLKENYVSELNKKEFLAFVAQYKFTLAFENAICDDYITEKLWRPLIVGSVPIYYGSPSFKDWLPNNHSAISVNDFPHPRDLAKYLHELSNNDEKYNNYLKHKLYKNEINNDRLIKALGIRPNNLYSVFGHYVHEFECFVCQQSHLNEFHTMTRKQYNCSKPNNMWGQNDSGNNKNFWTDVWEQEACTAKLLFHALSINENINMQKFHIEKMEMYESKNCS